MASGYFEVKTLLPPQFSAARLKEKLGKTSFQLKDFFRSKAAKRELKLKNVGFIVNIWSYQVLYQRLLGVIRSFSLSSSFRHFSLFGCHQSWTKYFFGLSALFSVAALIKVFTSKQTLPCLCTYCFADSVHFTYTKICPMCKLCKHKMG